MHNGVTSAFGFVPYRDTTFVEFVAEFHVIIDKVEKLGSGDEINWYVLLHQSAVDNHKRNIIVRASGGDYL